VSSAPFFISLRNRAPIVASPTAMPRLNASFEAGRRLTTFAVPGPRPPAGIHTFDRPSADGSTRSAT